VVSKDGNFLLNVGPTGEGIIPEPSVERLREVGQWMQANGDAIYGTSANPFKQALPWGYCTRKTTGDGAVLYLHVFNPPKDGTLVLPGLKNKAESTRLLTGGNALTTKMQPEGLIIELPTDRSGHISTTVALTIKGALKIE